MIYKLSWNQGTSEEGGWAFFPLTSLNGCTSEPVLLALGLLLGVESETLMWHWQPWHSQQRDQKEREEEKPRRGKVRKSRRGSGGFFFSHTKSIAATSPNVLDRVHARKTKEGAGWIPMEIKLGWEDFFCSYFFPSSLRFQCVAYESNCGYDFFSPRKKKDIKKIPLFYYPGFSFWNKAKCSTNLNRKCVLLSFSFYCQIPIV